MRFSTGALPAARSREPRMRSPAKSWAAPVVTSALISSGRRSFGMAVAWAANKANAYAMGPSRVHRFHSPFGRHHQRTAQLAPEYSRRAAPRKRCMWLIVPLATA